jgi:hypothetical protein
MKPHLYSVLPKAESCRGWKYADHSLFGKRRSA